MITRKYEASPGENITTTAQEMVRMAVSDRCKVAARFNDVDLECTPDSTPESITTRYHAICNQRRAEYEASPEGIEAAKRHKEFEAKAAQAESEGVLPFSVKPDKQSVWDNQVKVNGDPYGACVVRYAARWANLMEQEIANGGKIKDFADRCSHEADKEGITGFMYGCAVSILAQVWTHGEALRLWHNRKTQIGTEGDKANEQGGVLNPALLNIGGQP